MNLLRPMKVVIGPETVARLGLKWAGYFPGKPPVGFCPHRSHHDLHVGFCAGFRPSATGARGEITLPAAENLHRSGYEQMQ
jgi:hypothetical protein